MAKMEKLINRSLPYQIKFGEERSDDKMELLFDQNKKYVIIRTVQNFEIYDPRKFNDKPSLSPSVIYETYEFNSGEEALEKIQDILNKGLDTGKYSGGINSYVVVTENENNELVLEGYLEQNVNAFSNEVYLTFNDNEHTSFLDEDGELHKVIEEKLVENLDVKQPEDEIITPEEDIKAPEEDIKAPKEINEPDNIPLKRTNLEPVQNLNAKSEELLENDEHSQKLMNMVFSKETKYKIIKLKKDTLLPPTKMFFENPKITKDMIEKNYEFKNEKEALDKMDVILQEGLQTDDYTGAYENKFLIVSENEDNELVVAGLLEQNVYSSHNEVYLTLNHMQSTLEDDGTLKGTLADKTVDVDSIKINDIDDIFGM